MNDKDSSDKEHRRSYGTKNIDRCLPSMNSRFLKVSQCHSFCFNYSHHKLRHAYHPSPTCLASLLNFIFFQQVNLFLWGHANRQLAAGMILELLFSSHRAPRGGPKVSCLPPHPRMPPVTCTWPTPASRSLFSQLHFAKEETKSQERWGKVFRNTRLIKGSPGLQTRVLLYRSLCLGPLG